MYASLYPCVLMAVLAAGDGRESQDFDRKTTSPAGLYPILPTDRIKRTMRTLLR
jgi:hypothetical protein